MKSKRFRSRQEGDGGAVGTSFFLFYVPFFLTQSFIALFPFFLPKSFESVSCVFGLCSLSLSCVCY